jgi:predicted site-specific integrase-resolvase
MKAAEVLKLARISRRHLSRLVNRGQIRVTIQPNGRYDYNREDVYLSIGSERQNLCGYLCSRFHTETKNRFKTSD